MTVKMLVAASTLALVAACTTPQTDTGSTSSSTSSTLSDQSAGTSTGSDYGTGTGTTGSMGTSDAYGQSTTGQSDQSGTSQYDAGQSAAQSGSAATGVRSDIVTVAQGAGQFSTLVSAIQTAGLVDTLKGQGPYTVFAPTDAAFKALPSGMLKQLMEPANKGRLVSVLTYHVVPGKIASTDLTGTQTLKTIQGGTLTVTRSGSASSATGSTPAMGSASTTTSAGGTVRVNDANVVAADVPASNGVVHAIDKVLIPTAKAS